MGDVQLGPVTALSPSDVASLWVHNGGDPSAAQTATAIVFSSENPAGNAGLVDDTASTGDYSVGLWQINYYGDLMAQRTAQFGSPAALAADPNLQAKAAIALSGNGTNWAAWGPDFGYSGYAQPVAAPLSGSRVANWLATNAASVSVPWYASVPWGAVAGAAAMLLVAGGAMWALEDPARRVPWLVATNPVSGEARLSYQARKHLPDSAFALPELRKDGKGGLPLTDAQGRLDPRHVSNAASRLAQMRKRGTVTGSQYDRARRAIERAACKTGVERTCRAHLRASAGAAEDGRLPPSMFVQSVLFPRDRYNVPEAKRWARSHGYRSDDVDVTERYIHLRQMPTTGLKIIRTITLPGDSGIKAHVGR